MITIQSSDLNTYIKSLVEKAMDDRFECDESADHTSHGENDHQTESIRETHKGWCPAQNRRI